LTSEGIQEDDVGIEESKDTMKRQTSCSFYTAGTGSYS